MNYIGGYRNTMTLVLTGLDIEDKARWATDQLFEILGGRASFEEVDVQLLRYDTVAPTRIGEATAHLRITVKDHRRAKVDRAFSNAVLELYVGGFAGFHTTTPPSSASEFGVYWPTTIPAAEIEHVVVHADGSRESIAHGPVFQEHLADRPADHEKLREATDFGPTTRGPLGAVVAARSGDKSGNANVGVWTDSAERWDWLRTHLTTEKFLELVTEARGFTVHRYEFPNLRALNFVIVGFLGDGVASSTRTDPQAKGLGEYLRAVHTDVPEELLAQSR